MRLFKTGHANISNGNNVRSNTSIITFILSFLTIILFFLCLLYAFGIGCNPGTISNSLERVDTTIATINTDTTLEVGKRMIVNNKNIVTTKSNICACATQERVSDKLDVAFKYFALLLGLFLILILLPHIESFTVGKDGLQATFNQLAKGFNQAQSSANLSQVTPTGGTAHNPNRSNITTMTDSLSFDPQKGKWGRLSANHFRRLYAEIAPIPNSDWVNIELNVESTDTINHPLKGTVTYHLHPTFPNPDPVIIVVNGVAELKFRAWGAFTLGAEADEGKTTLELDLSELPEAPEPFKSR